MTHIVQSLDLAQTESALREIRRLAGYANFDAVVKKLNRERIDPERVKRKRFPKSMYQRLYDKQQGVCPLCDNRLNIPATKNEIDHISPGEEQFNGVANLQLTHPMCNRKKSSKSVLQQSKESGRSFVSIVSRGEIE
jgi:CRISPR/Cas system Type II protein with McrA/HNH and RuvC-like nuclease domain